MKKQPALSVRSSKHVLLRLVSWKAEASSGNEGLSLQHAGFPRTFECTELIFAAIYRYCVFESAQMLRTDDFIAFHKKFAYVDNLMLSLFIKPLVSSSN